MNNLKPLIIKIKFKYFQFFFFLISTTVLAQPPRDCGCSAALRYDIFKSKNDFYSEMLLAREINQENYKDIQQQAGGNLSIFGVGIGANGENIQRIKEIYNERLYNRNVSAGMSEYESITTSNVSYATFKACMDRCIRSNASGVDAYIIAEDANQVVIDLHYAAAQASPPINITYNVGSSSRTVRLFPNTWASPAITIPRATRDAFSVTFSPGGQYETAVVSVRPYKPITADLSISYTLTREQPGSPIAYSAVTRNNSSGEKGTSFERMIGPQADQQAIQRIVGMADGSVSINDYIFSSEGFWATRVGFKASAKDGYLLRNPHIGCRGGACGGWTENAGFIRNDQNLVIYTEKRYSASCIIDFTVDTYKILKTQESMEVISTNNAISIVMPPGNSEGVIRYTGGALRLGESNAFLTLNVRTVSADGYETYDYRINPPPSSQPTRTYRLFLN